jgi:hypothetical protein
VTRRPAGRLPVRSRGRGGRSPARSPWHAGREYRRGRPRPGSALSPSGPVPQTAGTPRAAVKPESAEPPVYSAPISMPSSPAQRSGSHASVKDMARAFVRHGGKAIAAATWATPQESTGRESPRLVVCRLASCRDENGEVSTKNFVDHTAALRQRAPPISAFLRSRAPCGHFERRSAEIPGSPPIRPCPRGPARPTLQQTPDGKNRR